MLPALPSEGIPPAQDDAVPIEDQPDHRSSSTDTNHQSVIANWHRNPLVALCWQLINLHWHRSSASLADSYAFGDDAGAALSRFGALLRGDASGPKQAPTDLPGFPDAKRAKPKTAVQGGGKLRRRWIGKDGSIYEWDSQHGTVEKYNKRGKHLGEYDPVTGEETKPADPSRKVTP